LQLVVHTPRSGARQQVLGVRDIKYEPAAHRLGARLILITRGNQKMFPELRMHIKTHYPLPLLLLIFLLLPSCQTMSADQAYPMREALIGKTKQQVIACAGTPLAETEDSGRMELTYYQEAPIMERSSIGSKGSRTLRGHGCRARVRFENDLVTDVQYIPIPAALGDFDHCEEIFESCRR
jgi:hypothetical protein